MTINIKNSNTRNIKNIKNSLNTKRVEVPRLINSIIHIIYNHPKSAKTAPQSRYATAIKLSKVGNKKFSDNRRIPPDESLLNMKITKINRNFSFHFVSVDTVKAVG